MTKTVLLLLSLFALLPAVCMAGENAAPGAEQGTGIEGTITAGPVHGGPVRKGTASTAPLANVSFEVKQGDKVITSFETDSQGHFRVILPPGQYTIARKDHQAAIGRYGPFEASVSQGKMTSVQWECDTGLR